ncbi:hypothetical protein [Nocardia sp. NPDC058705]|uniref:hypothetical protein n=1 Tax=Nocardia sp. NPDC058705 TaxID=3346609 RepID=UPI0036D1503C
MPEMSLDRHAEIDIALGGAVLVELSRKDTSAELCISVGDGGLYQVSLKSSRQPIVFPSDDILTHAGHLVDLHEEFLTNLRQVRYFYSKLPNGQWDMRSDFEYGRSA